MHLERWEESRSKCGIPQGHLHAFLCNIPRCLIIPLCELSSRETLSFRPENNETALLHLLLLIEDQRHRSFPSNPFSYIWQSGQSLLSFLSSSHLSPNLKFPIPYPPSPLHSIQTSTNLLSSQSLSHPIPPITTHRNNNLYNTMPTEKPPRIQLTTPASPSFHFPIRLSKGLIKTDHSQRCTFPFPFFFLFSSPFLVSFSPSLLRNR